MTDYTLYTKDTAPEKSRPLLAELEEQYGTNLNIFAHMAESPLPIKIYTSSQTLLNNEGTLTPEEVNIVQLAVSVENECEFCVPAHSTVGKAMFNSDPAVISAIRDGEIGPDARLDALASFTRTLTAKRGKISDADSEAFLSAGFTKEQIFEVLSIIAYKTITNYTSNIAGTRLNENFAAEAWVPLSKRGKSQAA